MAGGNTTQHNTHYHRQIIYRAHASLQHRPHTHGESTLRAHTHTRLYATSAINGLAPSRHFAIRCPGDGHRLPRAHPQPQTNGDSTDGAPCAPHTLHQASSSLSPPVAFSRGHLQHYEWPKHLAESTPTPGQRTGNIKPRSPGRAKEGVKLCSRNTHTKIVYYVARPTR